MDGYANLQANRFVKTGRTKNGADMAFRAFSDRTRLRILHVLQSGEMCVGDLVKAIQVPQPRASRHLAYLRRAGLVVARKDGLWTHYGLAPAESPFHVKLWECLAHCFDDVHELEADAARAAKLRRASGCCPK
jgi:ArsR family transcriptional regulator